MNVLAVTLALAAAFFWALGQVLIKIVVRDLNPTTSNMIRFSFAAVALTPFVLVNGLGPISASSTILAVIAGTFGVSIPIQIYFYCMKRTPAHRIIPIGNASPAFAVFLSLLLLGESITATLLLSLALIVCGAFLLVPQKKESVRWRPAIPLTMIVAILWGLDQTIRKPAIGSGVWALTFIWISMVSAAVLINLLGGVTRSWDGQHLNRTNVGLSLASIISGNLVGGFCYLYAVGMEKVSYLAPFTSAAIPFGFVLSVLIVGEKPTKKSAIGMVVIFLGVILAAI